MKTTQQIEQEIEQEIEETKQLIKQIVDLIEQNKKDLKAIQDNMNRYIPLLESLREKESILSQKIFNIKKDNIKDSINKGIGGILNNPLIDKIKEKGQQIKTTIEKTGIDKAWLEEQYLKYKEIAIKKGEKVNTIEEFLKFTNFIETKTNINLNGIFEKANKEINKISENLQTTYNSITKPKETKTQSVLPKTKKEGIELWVKDSHIESHFDKKQISELYENYVLYLNKIFLNKAPKEIFYSFNGNAFSKALKNHFQNDKQNVS